MADEDDSLDSDQLYRQWKALLERLIEATTPASGLPEPLATYVIDCAGAVSLGDVRALRGVYGADGDPPAEELWPLLAVDD